MPNAKADQRLEEQRKKLRANFSNYEKAVTLISSLHAWCEHRWGVKGKEDPGTLSGFNRFPKDGDLTPDFEITFKTPYVIWGDHKCSMPTAASGRKKAADQILKYASHSPAWGKATKRTQKAHKSNGTDSGSAAFDVVVIVPAENDDAAAESINKAREEHFKKHAKGDAKAKLAPIVVLGCYRDRESANGHWYKLKWRGAFDNCRFTSPNVTKSKSSKDLNALLVDSQFHPIPVTSPVLGLASRHPFINDEPPPQYTAVRLITPAIAEVLTPDDRDTLQMTGRVEKTVSRATILATDAARSLDPQPGKLASWVEAALEFMVTELKWATKIPKTHPQEYKITVDKIFLNADQIEWFSDRAARKSIEASNRAKSPKRFKGDAAGQMKMFD